MYVWLVTCGSYFELPVVAELAVFAEVQGVSGTGPYLTEPSLVEQLGFHHNLEVPWLVPEESSDCLEASRVAALNQHSPISMM